MKLILSMEDRVVGVQGYAGSGKTTMLNRARTLLEKKGYEVRGLAPSASAARRDTLLKHFARRHIPDGQQWHEIVMGRVSRAATSAAKEAVLAGRMELRKCKVIIDGPTLSRHSPTGGTTRSTPTGGQ